MSIKITERHLQRKAIVYVRQSTTQQITNNVESQRLQRAMHDRLRKLGWKTVEVIDGDLGRSARGTVERAGFQHMVAEVSLGAVGAVAARELSRFARNSREWQQLLEVCRFVDTILVDQEGVYDPRNSNDRLLLGLKGSLNEHELEILRLRAEEAKRAKARRGELIIRPPVGYVKTPDRKVDKDPDLRVQRTIALLLDKALELGGARQTMMWFLEEGLQIPSRSHSGSVEVSWRAPYYTQVLRILRNPTYAGAYVYGRRENVMIFEDGRPRVLRRKKAKAEWLVLLRDHQPSYIDWDRFSRLQEMIDKNAQSRWPTAPGAAKEAVGHGPGRSGGIP